MVELAVIGLDRPVIVDDDLAHLARFRWKRHERGFIYRNGDRVVKLTRVIVGAPLPPGFVILHRNGDRWDYRRSNLSLITVADHCRLFPRRRPKIDVQTSLLDF